MLARAVIAGVALVGAMSACARSDTWEPRHAGRDTGPGAGLDAGLCASWTPWKLEPRRLQGVVWHWYTFADSHSGASILHEHGVHRESASEWLARVDVEIASPGDEEWDYLTLRAFNWTHPGAPHEPVVDPVLAMVHIPGRVPIRTSVLVFDGHDPEVTTSITHWRLPECTGERCRCEEGQGPGTARERDPCVTDCDCVDGLACVANLQDGLRELRCRRLCAKVTDCPVGGCGVDKHGWPWICGPAKACPVFDCPPGFSCVDLAGRGSCRDDREPPTSAKCSCDAECAPGQRCIWKAPGEATCEVPCARDRDCLGAEWVCTTSSVCVRER